MHVDHTGSQVSQTSLVVWIAWLPFCPETGKTSPTNDAPHSGGTFVVAVSACVYHPNLQFTLGLILGIIRSMGLDTCIGTCITITVLLYTQ